MDEQLSELTTYIRQHLDQGVPEAHIRQVLVQYHWASDQIDRAFALVHPAAAPMYQPAPFPAPPATAARLANGHGAAANTAMPESPAPAVPRTYRLFRAIADAVRAARRNPAAVLLAVVCSCAVSLVLFLLVSVPTAGIVSSPFGLATPSAAKIITLIIGGVVLYLVWYVFSYAFTISITALAIDDGRDGRRSAPAQLFTNVAARLGRIAAANALLVLTVCSPLILAVFLPLPLAFGGSTGNIVIAIILVLILSLAAAVWACLAALRYALVPYVALFEPAVPLRQTFGRSRRLLRKGGGWFLVKGTLLYAVLTLVLTVTVGRGARQPGGGRNIAFSVVLILLSMLSNAVLVMLYRNRAAVADSHTASR